MATSSLPAFHTKAVERAKAAAADALARRDEADELLEAIDALLDDGDAVASSVS